MRVRIVCAMRRHPPRVLAARWAGRAAESDLAPPSLSESRGWWRTRDGRVLQISEMEDEHLENAIGLFERAGWGEHPKVLELKDERVRR